MVVAVSQVPAGGYYELSCFRQGDIREERRVLIVAFVYSTPLRDEQDDPTVFNVSNVGRFNGNSVTRSQFCQHARREAKAIVFELASVHSDHSRIQMSTGGLAQDLPSDDKLDSNDRPDELVVEVNL